MKLAIVQIFWFKQRQAVWWKRELGEICLLSTPLQAIRHLLLARRAQQDPDSNMSLLGLLRPVVRTFLTYACFVAIGCLNFWRRWSLRLCDICWLARSWLSGTCCCFCSTIVHKRIASFTRYTVWRDVFWNKAKTPGMQITWERLSICCMRYPARRF